MDAGFSKLSEAASYDRAAVLYGRHIERLAGPVADQICRTGRIAAGNRVLDVGCGTGVATRRAAVLAGNAGSVTGVDISEGMLAEARRLSGSQLEADSLRYERMDAERLEFPDGSFDVVVSLCAVLHFPRIDIAVAEMGRVLRPGGTLVIGFGGGRPAALLQTAGYALKRTVAIALAHGRPELRGPGLLLRLASEELPAPPAPVLVSWPLSRGPLPPLLDAMRSTGIGEPRVAWFGHEVEYDTARDLWDAQTAIVTEVRGRIAAASPAAIDRLQQRFEGEATRALARGGRLLYPYGATLLAATSNRT